MMADAVGPAASPDVTSPGVASPDAGDRRARIVAAMADHVLAHGLSAASLRPLAKAAGISDRMLLYYFKDKAEVIAATLALVGERLVSVMADRTAKGPLPIDQLRGLLGAALLADDVWPYMQLWLEIAALSARGDPIFRSIGEQMGRGFHLWGMAQLASATPDQLALDSARLLVEMEGMIVLKSVGLSDVIAEAR